MRYLQIIKDNMLTYKKNYLEILRYFNSDLLDIYIV